MKELKGISLKESVEVAIAKLETQQESLAALIEECEGAGQYHSDEFYDAIDQKLKADGAREALEAVKESIGGNMEPLAGLSY